MTVLVEMPEQAPIDLIIGSRELLRGKVRSRRLLSVFKSVAFAILFTFNAYAMSLADRHAASFPYWTVTTAGFVVGFVLGSISVRRRSRSPQRQQAAVEKAWTSTRSATLAPARSKRIRWLIVGMSLLVVTTSLVVALTYSDLRHAYLWILPLFGVSAGVDTALLLMTFRWATWYGAGAIDPDVAKQLNWAHTKALKVQHYAEIYAQSQPTTTDESS